MKSYPMPFPKGIKPREIKDEYEKYMPPRYALLSHKRFASTRYAKDLAVKMGTPVLAIEGGCVVSVKNDSDRHMNPRTHQRYKILFKENNLDVEELNRLDGELLEFSEKYTNYVQVSQLDDYIAEYVHLDRNVSVVVKQKVMQGDVIGSVGLNGLTTGSHLHLNLFENRSIPFNLRER